MGENRESGGGEYREKDETGRNSNMVRNGTWGKCIPILLLRVRGILPTAQTHRNQLDNSSLERKVKALTQAIKHAVRRRKKSCFGPHLILAAQFLSISRNVLARIKARFYIQQQHISASSVYHLPVPCILTTPQHPPTTTQACHACKRERTFSTVWHWEHLVLKIFAPFSADMTRCWW